MTFESRLLIAVEGNQARIVVMGQGTVRQGIALKRFYQNALLEGIDDFTLELKNCTAADSTFLGVILGMALKVKARNGHFRTQNAQEHVVAMMTDLGVDRLFTGTKPR